MASIASAIWQLRDALKSEQKADSKKSAATVSRVDPDGSVWVRLAGGTADTPITKPTVADVAVGDAVTVEVGGGASRILGNSTTPAIGYAQLVEGTAPIAQAAQDAMNAAGDAMSASESAEKAAEEAQEVAEAVNQHFFDDTDGIHVTEHDRDTWDTSHTGKNILINSLGILIRSALVNLVSITSSAIAFFDGNGNDASNIVAQFGSSSATIGKAGGAHSTIDSSGQRFYSSDGTTQLADIGYGESNDDGTVSNAPHYYFGAATDVDDVSDFDSTVKYTAGDTIAYDGKLYMAWSNVIPIGDSPDDTSYWQLCPGKYAHVEGEDCMVSDKAGHAEGHGTRVGGAYGHAEGLHTIANGGASHAEGQQCLSYGQCSHTQNIGNKTLHANQTAIGKWNDNHLSNALEIGNGTSDSARSNALTVDWSGNVECGTVNGVDVTDALTADSLVVEQKTSSSYTISANSVLSSMPTVNVAKTGYKALGIVGANSSNVNVNILRANISGTTAYMKLHNPTSSSISTTVTLFVLYVKTS